ncbi:RsmF rRNA methyltransferase first C-terminal domain-containing protein [Ammoniphilus sp. 3BR4]|uniref:RsmF rRNA methyltransferase first C-terminal domain-containing protein n=1 Tax=Ammoniphilus sp. 3BR4 TaxID=3158265 RepID=UPI003467699A
MKKIPAEFEQTMRNLLEGEFDSFMASYQESSQQGLRVNTLKVDPELFLHGSGFSLEPVPWCPSGFYYSEKDRPGKHPYHAAGVYYIQEPSAMSVVEFLQPKPGEKILDLCAAPGGKSTHIAAYLQGQGLLVTNEIHATRAKALSENIERCGVRNALVTNETPERLASRFPAFFDRILVDAPCSGEGMFRKLDEACEDWSPDKIAHCSAMQSDILDAAAIMLKPGGVIVYSTCTFSPEENEKKIASFLYNHPSFELEALPPLHGMASGRAEWAGGREEVRKTVRLWPHLLKGEGHFAARLRKTEGNEDSLEKVRPAKVEKQALGLFYEFCKEYLINEWTGEGSFLLFGDQLYFHPLEIPSIEKLKVLRPGWHLGTVKKGRFEPSHALALGLEKEQALYSQTFQPTDERLLRYLRGESLMVDTEQKGWALVCVEKFPVGWGKISNGQLKNHYPKGLRWV